MRIQKPTVPEVLPLVEALYASERGGVGCCLHIVLDDHNLETYWVRWCVEQARQAKHDDCRKLAELMLQMSRTQRYKLAVLNGRPGKRKNRERRDWNAVRAAVLEATARATETAVVDKPDTVLVYEGEGGAVEKIFPRTTKVVSLGFMPHPCDKCKCEDCAAWTVPGANPVGGPLDLCNKCAKDYPDAIPCLF